MSCAKTAEPIEKPFEADSFGSKEPRIRWGCQDRTTSLAAAATDKTVTRPFARLLWTLAHGGMVPEIRHVGNTALSMETFS